MANNETASPPTAYLVDLVSNRKIPITTPRCRVGRDDLNDIVISGDQSISRFHFILTFEDGKYLVQDAKSRHGTFLNGNQISTPEPINDGDVLKIGVSLFWFVIEQPAEEGGDLSPVDTDKIKKEEINVARSQDGSMDISFPSGDLSSTQEIDIPSAEAMAKVEAEMEAEAKRKREESEKEPAETDEKEEEQEEEAENEEPEKEPEVEPESESGAERIEAESEESKEEEPPEEKIEDEEVEDEKPEAQEPEAKDEEEDEDEDPVAASVKSLLEPLHEDIAASKAMIDEALKKAQIEAAAREEEEAEEKEKAEREEEKEAPEPAEEEKPEEKQEGEPEEEPEEKAEVEDEEPEEAAAKEPEPAEAESEEEPEAAPDEEESEADEENASKNETLEKFAGIIEDSDDAREEAPGVETSATNGTDTSMAKMVEKMVSTNVPDWCKRYFSDELKGLNKELEELNEQIRKTESRIKEIEGQTALTKGLRNTLLTSEGDDLIEACKQVLGLCGWKVTQSDEDKNEILLEHDDDRVAIARIIWTKTSAERSHLGQLSISQTRYWCEKGTEPKGVLIVGKLSEGEPKDPSESAEEELTDYAGKKNVCLMSTLQLLAVYRDLALGEGSSKELRKAIHDCKGWLEGYVIEPGAEILDDEDEKDGKGSKSLSSLLSA